MTGQSALIIGATGAVGRHVLGELLSNPQFTHVGEFGRRTTPLENLPQHRAKLTQQIIDFENLPATSAFKSTKWDVVYITLGTTRKTAGSAEAFEKIDKDYVVAAAKEARIEGTDQRLVYLSSSGADPNSFFLYPKSKGLTEIALARLGYTETIAFRPGFLKNAERAEHRPLESIFGTITGALSHISSNMEIDVQLLGKSIATAGAIGVSALPKQVEAFKDGPPDAPFTVIPNKGALYLAK